MLLSHTSYAQENSVTTAGLNGRIKSLTEYNFSFAGTNAVEDDGGAWKVTSVFDENGIKKEELRYGLDNLLASRAEFRYSPSGRLERETNYDATGKYLYSNTWNYDKEGREIYRKHRSRERTVFLRTDLSYNDKGYLTRERTQARGGRTLSMARWKYDTVGNPIEEIISDADNIVTRRSRYRYNSNRKLIEEKNTYYGITVSTAYKYDSAGNMIAQTDYNAAHKPEKRIEYSYNSRGEETEQRTFNAYDVLQRTVTYRREYDRMGNLLKTVQADNEGETIIQQREIVYFPQ